MYCEVLLPFKVQTSKTKLVLTEAKSIPLFILLDLAFFPSNGTASLKQKAGFHKICQSTLSWA